MAFAELTRRQSFLMKPKAWLLITFVLCSWSAATRCVCARNQADIHLYDLPDTRNLICDGRLLAFNQCHSHAVYDSESSLANACMIKLPSPSFFRGAELPLDEIDRPATASPMTRI